ASPSRGTGAASCTPTTATRGGACPTSRSPRSRRRPMARRRTSGRPRPTIARRGWPARRAARWGTRASTTRPPSPPRRPARARGGRAGPPPGAGGGGGRARPRMRQATWSAIGFRDGRDGLPQRDREAVSEWSAYRQGYDLGWFYQAAKHDGNEELASTLEHQA